VPAPVPPVPYQSQFNNLSSCPRPVCGRRAPRSAGGFRTPGRAAHNLLQAAEDRYRLAQYEECLAIAVRRLKRQDMEEQQVASPTALPEQLYKPPPAAAPPAASACKVTHTHTVAGPAAVLRGRGGHGAGAGRNHLGGRARRDGDGGQGLHRPCFTRQVPLLISIIADSGRVR
jgi:hypothetical protein